MTNIKVHNGTKPNKFLCQDCQRCVRIDGPGCNDERHICKVTGKEVQMRVVCCTSYQEPNIITPNAFAEDALYIYKSENGKIHFLRACQIQDCRLLQRLDADNEVPAYRQRRRAVRRSIDAESIQ